MRIYRIALVSVLLSVNPPASEAQVQPGAPLVPNEVPGLAYTNEFFPGATCQPDVPTQKSLLGFASGERAASAPEIERCLKAWSAAAPDRVRLLEYARSHEGRPLYLVVVTAPKNLSRLEEIRSAMERLGDPRKISEGEAEQLIGSLPAIAWLAYTIHGDETEGSDAALAVLYHLVAANDPETQKLLQEVVVIIDPLQNPDGRDRFIKMIAENRGTAPNVDAQSLLHTGYWPRGRGNHYLFDLNRDFILGVHPETRGRIRELGRWNPVLYVDAHGMGAQATHLFSPPREPINPNLPEDRKKWGAIFAADQARAFDRYKLFYYHGEWNEEWYPGYGDSWAAYRGAVGILYEQARIAEDGVRRPEGRILSYRESVHHHVIGSMANLATLKSNARALLRSFYANRQSALAADGPYAKRTFAVLPTANHSRLRSLTELLRLQGIEIYEATNEFKAILSTDQLGREAEDRRIPKGTLLIPNRQPLGHLVAAMLEFDPRFSAKVLEEERRELLLKGKSRIYDTTAWNLTMLYGLEALSLHTDLPEAARAYQVPPPSEKGLSENGGAPVACVINGADDFSVAAAARLMERGLQVRVADKPFRLSDRDFDRGSVLVTALDNRRFEGDLLKVTAQIAQELGLAAVSIDTGYGAGELPDLGGEHFVRLEPPRIAIFGGEGVSPGDYGATWYVLDHRVTIRHSNVDAGDRTDLSRYNVLVVPEGRPANLSSNQLAALRDWVKDGGTLIAVGASAGMMATEKADLSKARPLPDVLGKLADYELAVFREWIGRTGQLPTAEAVWSHQATPGFRYPWPAGDGAYPEEKELKRRDAWQALFMPEGTMLASRVDTNHWLSFGAAEWLPVLVGRQPVLMAAEGVEAPIRYGYFTSTAIPTNRTEEATNSGASPDSTAKSTDKRDKKELARVGWCALPEGTQMHLRMSGLLWPEAAQRLANAAWATRERCGRGQIILFATPPTFRAAAHGMTRVMLNALIYGPGFGAEQPIRP